MFYNNCFKNGILPVRSPPSDRSRCGSSCTPRPGATLTVDLPGQTVTDADGTQHASSVDGFAKRCLLEGLSDIALTLEHEAEIRAFEERHRRAFAWLPLQRHEPQEHQERFIVDAASGKCRRALASALRR